MSSFTKGFQTFNEDDDEVFDKGFAATEIGRGAKAFEAPIAEATTRSLKRDAGFVIFCIDMCGSNERYDG